MTNDPSFYNAATTYPEEVRNKIFDQISNFHLKRELFNNNKKDFEDSMLNLRKALETIAKIPLPECLEGNTYRYSTINLGGLTNLYKKGTNKLPESKPPVYHTLRRDLSDWIRDDNSEIFEKLDFLRIKTNDWSHDGKHDYYDALPEDMMKNFKGFVIGFKAFLDMVYRKHQEP